MVEMGIWSMGLVLVMAAAGCGSSSAGSCSTSSSGMVTQCSDYGDGYTSAQVMQSCSAAQGTYSASACPSTGRVARCTISLTIAGTTATATQNYYSPNTAASVMQACSAQNTGGITATFQAN